MQTLKRFLFAFLAAVMFAVGGFTPPALAQSGEALNTPSDVAAVTVLVTATKLLSGVTINGTRYRGFWMNPTDGEIAIGGRSVTALTGVLVATGEKVFIPWTYGQDWYAIRTGGSNVNVRIVPVR